MRFIDFVLPGKNQNILVQLEERPDGTVLIHLTVDGKPADIRGLFFDFNSSALISKLSVSGANVTTSKFLDEGVIDLGNGVNMQGEARGPFDVGVAFGSAGNGKDMVTDTTLVLKSSAGPLTLDQLALVDFGVRLTGGGSPPKIVVTAPAAPDAINDSFTGTEDTHSVFSVLANDTDRDGTADFRITSVTDPEHGTATISSDGKTVLYLPDHDYSGPDSFGYTMIDGHGGGDNAIATIGVTAVADAPNLTVTTAAGANVNQVLITVTAAVTDTDGSEYLDRFDFSGLPSGASIVGESDLTYSPTSTGQMLSQTFTLDLAPNTDFNFALGVSAVSKELSNGSEANTAKSVSVIIDSHHNAFDVTFHATDQSIWGSGNALMITDDRFLGFDFDPPESSSGGFIYGAVDFALKAGFQSTLKLNAGSIDATIPYDISVDTTYNHVTDVLKISSSALLDSAGAFFNTYGPGGSYALDFIFNWAIKASAGIDLGVKYDLFSFNQGANNSINILNIDSHDLGISYDFPFGISASLAWPQIDTSSNAGGGTSLTSSGESNNFFELGLDVDQLLADLILKKANPFDITVTAPLGVAEGNIQLLDVDLTAGLNLLQDFLLSVKNLTGTLTFEDGSTQAWSWADIILNNASSKDADHDGMIEYSLTLGQPATLTNDLSLGVNLGYSVDLVKGSGTWNLLLDSGTWTLDPLAHFGGNMNVADVALYDTSFDLHFGNQTINFVGNEILL